MGGYANIPKPVTTSRPPPLPPPPPSPQPQKPNLPMLYYGLVVVATAAIILAVYNLIIVRWCANQYHRSQEERQLSHRRRNPASRNHHPRPTMSPPSPPLSQGGSTVCLVSSFKYKKERDATNKNESDYDTECSVCLSVFEDGDEVRKLPRCDHSFHASCIDMWLYSHFDCPLCRAPVVELLPPPAPAPTSSV